jgi:hypothetical protein
MREGGEGLVTLFDVPISIAALFDWCYIPASEGPSLEEALREHLLRRARRDSPFVRALPLDIMHLLSLYVLGRSYFLP